jgi:hypothetical protein
MAAAAVAAWGCSAGNPENTKEPSRDPTAMEFKAIGTNYRGRSVTRPDGRIESRPVPQEKEAKS